MSILLVIYILFTFVGSLFAVALIGTHVYTSIMERRFHQSLIHARLWHGFKR